MERGGCYPVFDRLSCHYYQIVWGQICYFLTPYIYKFNKLLTLTTAENNNTPFSFSSQNMTKYENSCLDFVYFSILGKGISGCPYMDYGGYIVDSGGYMYQGRF